MKKNTIVKDALVLFAITLIAGILLGLVHDITLAPIALSKENAAKATYTAVFPDAASFDGEDELQLLCDECSLDPAIQDFGKNVSVNAARRALDANGEVIGYIVEASAKGYGGPVKACIGIDNNGTVTGLGFLSINETPGLGMKAKEDSFRNQFPGMTASEDMSITAISGATKTSKAVTADLRAAAYFLEYYVE